MHAGRPGMRKRWWCKAATGPAWRSGGSSTCPAAPRMPLREIGNLSRQRKGGKTVCV